jgi:hypothetical protein
MPDPTWLGYFFAVIMMVVGGYCFGRLVAFAPMGRATHVDVNLGHVLMAIAMCGMLVPRWSVLSVGFWEIVFGVMAAWFLGRAITVIRQHGVSSLADGDGLHLRHYLIHMVMACTMLYMYWLGMPVTASTGSTGGSMAMSGPPANAGDPGLTLFLIVVLLASVVWRLNQIDARLPSRQPAIAVAGDGLVGDGGATNGADQRQWLAPRLEEGCHIAMCVAMAFMLVLMV